MGPGIDKIDQPSVTFFRVKAFDQFRNLCRDTPVAFTALAAAAEVTSKSQQRCRSDINRICAQRNSFYNIGRGMNRTADDNRDISADTFISQPLIDCCKRQFNRNAYIIPDTGRCGTCSALKTVKRDNIRTTACNTLSNGRNVMDCGDLDNDRLFIFSRFLKRKDKLA